MLIRKIKKRNIIHARVMIKKKKMGGRTNLIGKKGQTTNHTGKRGVGMLHGPIRKVHQKKKPKCLKSTETYI